MNKTVGTSSLTRLSFRGRDGDGQLTRPRRLRAVGAPDLIQRDSWKTPGGNPRGDWRMLAGDARDKRVGERMQF